MKVLVPLISRLSFIERDIATLERDHDVVVASAKGAGMLRCLGLVLWSDLIFCWFASVRFLPIVALARVLGRKVVVIAGGYDVANQPAIGYGNMRSPIGRLLGRAVLHLAHVVSSYSEAGAEEVALNGRIPRDRQRLIYLGFDPPQNGDTRVSKQPLVLTVARVNLSTLDRKGLRLVARTAARLNGVRCVLVGRCDADAAAILTRESNGRLELLGFLPDEAVAELYRQAAVYLQPSYHEAFGCSVAEAMLWNCIPVVTARCSLPEVVGPAGYYVPVDGTPAEIADRVRTALSSAPPTPETPRDRILRCFPSARREKHLLALVSELQPARKPAESPSAGWKGGE